MLVPDRSDHSAQDLPGITDQTKRKPTFRVLPEGIVTPVSRLVDLRVANNPLAELAAVFRRLGADPENGDVIFLVSAVFIDKGRNLGPTPWSPLPAIENQYNLAFFQQVL